MSCPWEGSLKDSGRYFENKNSGSLNHQMLLKFKFSSKHNKHFCPLPKYMLYICSSKISSKAIQTASWTNIALLLFSRSVMSESLRPPGLQQPGFPFLYHLLKFDQTHVHWVGDVIQPSPPLLPPSPPVLSCPAKSSFPMSWLFASGSQSIEASASVLPVNIQDWFPLGLTGFISLQSKQLSEESSATP